jgi:hypothetical protein
VGGAALVLWCASAAVGMYLLVAWLSHGGLRQQATRITVFPAALIFAHPLLAVTGLALWIAYLATGAAGLAWTAFALVCATALLGFVMFTRWLGGRGGRHARGSGQQFPVTAIALHVVVGLLTFILVLLVAGVAGRR